jgi:hypothetical protein
MPGTGDVPGDAVTLRAENARLRMLLEDKDAQIAALKTQNAELVERVARLERLISLELVDAPSTDDLPGRSRLSARPGGPAVASRASSRARRGPAWPGESTRTRPKTCSGRAAAGAALTWPARLTWGYGTPARSLTCPRQTVDRG